MAEIQNQEIFNKEIAELEAKLAAKKQELMTAGVESPEKLTFKQVVREHVSPGEAQPQSAVPSASQVVAQSTRTVTAAEEEKINVMIAHAFTHGLAAAISEAKKTGDAFFVDLLHDRLADEYYTKLLAAHKVNPS